MKLLLTALFIIILIYDLYQLVKSFDIKDYLTNIGLLLGTFACIFMIYIINSQWDIITI